MEERQQKDKVTGKASVNQPTVTLKVEPYYRTLKGALNREPDCRTLKRAHDGSLIGTVVRNPLDPKLKPSQGWG